MQDNPTPSPHGDVTVHLPVRWPAVGWAVGLVVFLALGVWGAAAVRTVTIPLIAALALAYVLNPVVDRMVALGIQRQWAIILLMFGFVLALSILLLALGPRLIHEAGQMPLKLSQAMGEIRPYARQVLGTELPDGVDAVLRYLQGELTAREVAPFSGSARELGNLVRVVFGGTVSALATVGSIAMVPLFFYAFLEHFHAVVALLRSLFPPWARGSLMEMVSEIDTMLSSFVRGQLIVGAILAVLYSIGFFLVHLPLALLVGMMTGLGNMVPFVGTGLGLAVATLMALLSWRGVGHLMLIYLVFAVVHVLEAWVITPRIVGRRVGLSPFLVIVAVLVFGEMLGFFGVLIAVPMTAVLKIVGRHVLRQYRASLFYRGLPTPP